MIWRSLRLLSTSLSDRDEMTWLTCLLARKNDPWADSTRRCIEDLSVTVGCVDEIAQDASRDVTAWHSIQLEGVSAVAVVTLNLLGVGHRLTILDPREYECRRHLVTDRYFTVTDRYIRKKCPWCWHTFLLRGNYFWTGIWPHLRTSQIKINTVQLPVSSSLFRRQMTFSMLNFSKIKLYDLTKNTTEGWQ